MESRRAWPVPLAVLCPRLSSEGNVTTVGTGCASPGTLPAFPGPRLYTTKLTGLLVGLALVDTVLRSHALLPLPESRIPIHLWLLWQILEQLSGG